MEGGEMSAWFTRTATTVALTSLVLGINAACSTTSSPTFVPTDAARPPDAFGAADASALCDDTESDPENCGSCGHSCVGGACKFGQCQAVTIGRANLLTSIAVDSKYVYVANRNPSGIYRFDKNAPAEEGRTEVVTSADVAYAYHVLAAEPDVFWADVGRLKSSAGGVLNIIPDSGAIGRLASDGTISFLARPTDQPTDVFVDGDTVYWGSITGLFAAPKTGGSVRRLEDGRADRITVDGDSVYVADFEYGRVWRIAKDANDGAGEVVAEVPQADCIDHDPDALYVCIHDVNSGTNSAVARVTRNGEVSKIVEGGRYIADLVLEPNHVVYADAARGLYRVPKDGSAAPTLLHEGRPRRVVMDERAFYFTERELGLVRRLAR
jgi:hypothetical protein